MSTIKEELKTLEEALYNKLKYINQDIREAKILKESLDQLKANRKLIDQTYSKVKLINIRVQQYSESELKILFNECYQIFKSI